MRPHTKWRAGLAHDDRGKAVIGDLRDPVRGAPRLVPELRQRKPEGRANLVSSPARAAGPVRDGTRAPTRSSAWARRSGPRDRRGGRDTPARDSSSPTSSWVSRQAAVRAESSPPSSRPPGNAMCPDHGSSARIARSMKSTSAPALALAQHQRHRRIGRRRGIHPGCRTPCQSCANEIDPHAAPA